MIKPICDFCHKELTDFGGILFDPPFAKGVIQLARKRHVCVNCMKRFDALPSAPETPTERRPAQLTASQADALVRWSEEAAKPKGCSGYGPTFDGAMDVADALRAERETK